MRVGRSVKTQLSKERNLLVRTNKLHSLDSCVLMDLPTLICIKYNGDDKLEELFVHLFSFHHIKYH